MSPAFLIFALQGLGDSLEATPLISALRAEYPESRIDVAVTRTTCADLFSALSPLVTDTITLPYWDRGRWSFMERLLRRCRRNLYDATFMTYPSAKIVYHVVNACFRARRKLGHRYEPPLMWNMLGGYTDLVPIRAAHNVERNLDLLTPLSIQRPSTAGYAVPPEWYDTGPRMNDLVSLHVGTIAHDGFESKRWPIDRFVTVARALIALGARVTAIAGPDEVAETLHLRNEVPGVALVQGSLVHVARHLSRSGLAISNDSGIAHLAVGMGTPTISLFGPTPLTGAPYGSTSIPLRPSSCAPCFDPLARGIHCRLQLDFKCIRHDLPAEIVIQSAMSVLEAAPFR